MKNLPDLDLLMRQVVAKTKVLNNPLTYGYGNGDALMKWIAVKDKMQVEQALGIGDATKYPLIWLVEGWRGKEESLEVVFENVVFHFSVNSNVTDLNEAREPTFKLLFDLMESFDKQMRYFGFSVIGDITYTKRANFCATNRDSHTIDVWDTVIIQTSLRYIKKC